MDKLTHWHEAMTHSWGKEIRPGHLQLSTPKSCPPEFRGKEGGWGWHRDLQHGKSKNQETHGLYMCKGA